MDLSTILIAILIAFLWSIASIINKSLMDKFGHISLMTFSWLVYSAIMIALMIKERRELLDDIYTLTRNEIFLLLASGLFSGFLANYLYYSILENNDSSAVVALTYSTPLFTVLLAYLVLGEKINCFTCIGVLLIVVGVMMFAINN